MVPKHGNEEQSQIIPDYSHDFASGPAGDSIKLIIPLIIPNYSFDYS